MPLPSATLVPLDITDPAGVEVLAAQRRICTWGESAIPQWREAILAGERQMFWICVPRTHPTTLDIPVLAQPDGTVAIGHIALDRLDIASDEGSVADPSLASGDGEVVTLAALFILPAYGKGGLGRWAIAECERRAREQGAKTVTLNTLSPRHTLDGGIEGIGGLGVWPLIGIPAPPRSHVNWYKSMGYKEYKEHPRYEGPRAGEETLYLWCVCLRKELV